MASVKVYFVLYIVLLCELFLVILDRDDAEDAWIKQFKQHDSEYQLDFSGRQLNDTINASEKGDFKTFLVLTGMVSNEEKDNVELKIDVSDSKTGEIKDSLVFTPQDKKPIENKNLKFSLRKIDRAVYEIDGNVNGSSVMCYASFKTKRGLPSYLPSAVVTNLKAVLLNDLKKDGNNKALSIFKPMLDKTVAESEVYTFKIISTNHKKNEGGSQEGV